MLSTLTRTALISACAAMAAPTLAADAPPTPPTAPSSQGSTTNLALIEIHHAPREEPGSLAWLFGSGDEPTLREMVDRFHDVANDASFRGVVVRVRDATLKMTQAEELGAAMDSVRATGKKVHLFADGYETSDFVLASHADEVILQSGGAVSLPGMYMEEMYLADTLAWVGLTPQLVQIGDYKGANESMMRSSPSPQWDQNISGLLDGIYGNLRQEIKTGRKLTDAQLDDAMKKSWMATGETAKDVGLVDSLVDLPGLTEHLEKEYQTDDIAWTDYDSDSKHSGLDMSNPLAMIGKLTRQPEVKPTRNSIAIVHIAGPIIDGESEDGGLMGERSVGSVTIRRALSEIEDEDKIKGVIVRIDSPGGSAIASEVIWEGVQRIAKTKPVWVSVGSMAASGGYYVAVSAQKIYVNPSSIVGSIGVVGGKIALGGAYEKLKIHAVGRARGPMGDMLSSANPWTDAQKALVREKMAETYDLFTKRVSAGRAGIDLSKTAEGRLFTGKDAIKMKMADKVGGLDNALDDLAAELSLKDGDYDILDYPGPKSLMDVMSKTLGSIGVTAPVAGAKSAQLQAPAMAVGVLQELVGPQAWPSVRDNLSAVMQLRKEPVLLISPSTMIIK